MQKTNTVESGLSIGKRLKFERTKRNQADANARWGLQEVIITWDAYEQTWQVYPPGA